MATLGFVVLAVGAQAPIAFIVAFLPMLFIAAAYQELNRQIPDCGTTFTWATKAFGPRVGWMGGWGVAVAGMRETRRLTQSDLARKAGTSRPTISRLERGKAISDETVLNIVASMGYELIAVPRGYMVRVESVEH